MTASAKNSNEAWFPMGQTNTTPPRRTQHAAMRDDGGSDDYRERARTGRGVTSSDRPGSPPQGARHRSRTQSRHRQHPRDHREQREPSVHGHHRSRDRSRDHARRELHASSRHPAEPEDLIPRYRESKARASETATRPSHRGRSRTRSRDRGGPGSPSSSKRHRTRSRSLSSSTSHRKRHKKSHSPLRREKDHSSKADSKRRSRHSHDRRDSSSRRYRSPNRSERSHHHSRQKSLSNSPSRSEKAKRHSRRESRHRYKSESRRHRSRSRSAPSEPRKSSSRREYHSRDRHTARERSRENPERRSSHREPGARSPRSHRERKRGEDFAEPRHSSRSDVEDDMTSRSSYRGGHNPAYSHPSHQGNDSRGYSPSPQHPASYHNSPSPTPYASNRSGWGGHQYSPQHQYPTPYHHVNSNYGSSNGPPTGPHGTYHTNSSQSAPFSAPSGPQGSYRGGSRGGFRGAAFSNRGAYRGSNFKSAPRGSQGPSSRGSNFASEEDKDRRPSASNVHNDAAGLNEAMTTEGNVSIRSSDATRRDPNDDKIDQNVHTAKQPPSKPGASSAKFSFAFKPSSKPAPTAPKPEISQKFNAVPQRKEPTQTDNQDREPPPSAPTEPSSARARRDFRNPPDGPKIAPRTRMVMKILRRPKPRPTLSADIVESESVFFRKPGNESVVGSGTYGKVFKGLNVYTKGLVALKRIRMEGERDGFPVTAVREIKLLQSLRHTNIVNLQEVMVEKNDCFMVFEYLSHDLTGLLNHPSFTLDPSQKKHLAKQLFEGLDYLHERGVLHRDIKAANILVSSEGILKLADFGLARFYAKRHQLNYTNRVITIWYRSPELLLGETKYTAAVDVWSAACVMVEIFTRNAIFAGDGTELSQLDKIYNILGNPSRQDWPGIVDMAWFELLRPTAKRKNVFAEKYRDRVTPAAFDLLEAMFCYDPAKRPTAATVLRHPYFTKEEPLPRQAIELANIGGDWHEFESKALRKENERRDREARRAAKDGPLEKEKKRATESHDRDRIVKRIHVDQKENAGAMDMTSRD